MKLCIECYKKIYRDRSQVISISEGKHVCEYCEKEDYIVTDDYPGMLIISNSS